MSDPRGATHAQLSAQAPSRMDNLTSEQSDALAQLRAITNGADDEVTVSVLQSVDWDLQVRLFFFFLVF